MASSYMPVYLVFLFSTILSFSNGSKDQEYKICSSLSSCGPVNDIRYPFWIEPNKPGYCGLYEFKLDCYNASDYPQMWKIQGLIGSYRVNSINTTNRTIVVNRDMNETCYALKQSQQDSANSKWQFFKLAPSVGNLTLSTSCRNNPNSKFLTGSLLCPGNNVSVSVYHFNDPAEVGSKCKRTVTFPVSKSALDEFIKNVNGGWKLENVLEEAFEVEYSYDGFETCLKCQNSEGVCGSSVDSASNGLKCYHQAQRPDLGLILGLGITGAAVLIVIVPLAVFCYRKKIKFGYSKNNLKSLSHNHTNSDLENGSLYFGVPLFSYKDIQESTGNFDESRVLGNGGFGRVYYGKLNNGTEVAVKQLYEKSYGSTERFINEVQVLTQLKHQNLVSLYGCTSPQCRELFLVYEYMRNGTVADHLFSEQPNSKFLTWPSRIKIAIEAASALSYLHSSGIIHRDVKTKNILLDENFSVKVADFGLSRLFPIDVTHVSTAPQGSPGYLDPDYHQFYQLTDKSDVYSFGVVLIELISSLPAIDMNRQKSEINLSNFAMKRIQKCAFEELVDKRLGFGSDLRVRRMTTSVAELAFRCLQHDKEVRPSMEEVFEVLKRIESADYREELAVRDKELRTHHTQLVPPSPTKEDDRSRLLMSSMDLDQQRKRPPSPDSVMDEWVSRSGTSSSISAEKQQAS